MNQTVSEKTSIDYLFVVQNSEPKQFVFYKRRWNIGFLEIFKLKIDL